jgi:4-carboxymuconolactone decarboxylase
MSSEEAFVYDFIVELTAHHGVSDATYREGIERFGERGVVDLVGLIGYFALMSMVLNVARTPPNEVEGVAALPAIN